VKRFIADEAHDIIISDEFHPDFDRLMEIALRGCQRVYLTATLPPHLESYFMMKTMLQRSLSEII